MNKEFFMVAQKMIQYFCFLAVFLLTASPCSAHGLPELSDLAERTGKAVVNISIVKHTNKPEEMRDFFNFDGEESPFEEFFDQFEKYFNQPQRKRRQRSLGSGFIISEDGYIVTNFHVVADADEVKVNLQDHGKESESYTAKVVGRDKETDLAVLKIDADDLPVLEFGDSDKLKVGEWVMAIGNPFGLDHTVTAGIVSAKSREIGASPFDDYIQTDASINPGNSGGPLLNMNGEVVGINTAIVATGQGIGFAIPSNMAQEIITQLREEKPVQRGWIGVSIQDVDENVAKALGMGDVRGALVSNVFEGQPAAKAGVKTGDVILKINGEHVEDANDLTRKIAGLAPGDKANLVIWRKGKTRKATVKLGQRDIEKFTAQLKPEAVNPSKSVLGLKLKPVNKREAKSLGLSKTQGLLITLVEEGSAAEEAGLMQGDVLLEANQQPVDDVKEFSRIVAEDGDDKGVVMVLLKRDGQNLFRTIVVEE